MKRKPHKGGAEMLYGRQPVREMLRAGRRRVEALLLARESRRTAELEEIEALAAAARVPVRAAPRRTIQQMVGTGNHQGVAARVGPYPYVDERNLAEILEGPASPVLLLFLDHLEDPQNVGSLLRTAEASGVAVVILPADRAAGVTPAVTRASAGAAEHLRVARVTNLVRSMRLAGDRGVRLVGLEAVPEARPIHEVDLSGDTGLIVGSEARGLGRLVRETCAELVRLPRRGRVGSLNAAVAVAMALYEAVRQRGS